LLLQVSKLQQALKEVKREARKERQALVSIQIDSPLKVCQKIWLLECPHMFLFNGLHVNAQILETNNQFNVPFEKVISFVESMQK